MSSLHSISLIAALGLCHFSTSATGQDDIKQQLTELKAQIALLEQRLAEQEATVARQAAQNEPVVAADDTDNADKSADGIRLGGAIRTNYSHTSYSDGTKIAAAISTLISSVLT